MEINGRGDSVTKHKKQKKNRLNRKGASILTRSIPATNAENELIQSQIQKTGPLFKAGKKAPAAAAFTEFKKLEEEEDIDLDKQLVEEDEWNWLSSSAISSPSSFFEEYRFFSSLHLSIDDWLISWLSTLADSYIHLNKAETKKKKNMESNLKEESYSEKSKWISFLSDTESYHFDGRCSNDNSVKNLSPADDVEEPLYWPCDWKSDWSSPETWKCFSMSPRKGTTPEDRHQGRRRRSSCDDASDSCNSIELKFGAVKSDSRRRLEFNSEASKLGTSEMEELESNYKAEMGGEVSIERVMGLAEFDGHEGVDSPFNYDVFSIDDDDDDI